MSNPAQNNYDETTVSHVSRPADEAWKQAQSIVSDDRYSREYKHEQVRELFGTASRETETRYMDKKTELEAKIKTLEAAVSHVPILADDTDIAKLTYTRDVLSNRWENMTLSEMQADWVAAMDRKDLVTVKVYQDFAQSVMVAKNPTHNGIKSTHSPFYERLAEQSQDLLSTPEQKKAKKDLAYWKQTLLKVHMAHGSAAHRLRNPRIDAAGTLMDGVRADYMRRLRG